ncbi:NAD-dependent epimerase/dehydratase family protein [Paenibacillus physcomitrellae]|uniref:NAD dependent epimerase/dehydratase n=1 Tax=Paenibacillus physcomitrellae TaxID=1619311 RepID=A0ABQ1GTT1_9BACL|nr:NAD-dependent epimerase/dehydratase family protein [Paenibacillus physcomitrellae]GGA50240.1 NAD dependent epimerase/dehydratase [Paenibacillus physcomitrellae]
MKILILGGTRFFGKRLVEKLIEAGDEVTIATRGLAADTFGDQVKRVQTDRQEKASLEALAAHGPWDLIYDNICFASTDASDAVETFSGLTERYILTSTLSVYDQGREAWKEEDVDTLHHPVTPGRSRDFSYAEGKRQAEAVLFQQARFSAAAVRIPFVIGEDDYTERMLFHVRQAREGAAVQAYNPDARISFISSEETAQFLFWLGRSTLQGPVNAASSGTLSLTDIMRTVREVTGANADIEVIQASSEPDKQRLSPYAIEDDYGLDTTTAEQAGYTFTKIADWFPDLIRTLDKQVTG